MDEVEINKNASIADTPTSVFEKHDDFSDVTLMVEGRALHFPKLLLRLVSPVFDRMFTSDFQEKDSDVIPLPDKKLRDMDIFLQNIHPAYAWKPLNDDSLEVLLPLSSEYQTKHIREKCVHYMSGKIQFLNNDSDDLDDRTVFCFRGFSGPPKKVKDVVFYLMLCDQYEAPEVKEKLIQIASTLPVKALESDSRHQRLSDATKTAILRARCHHLEQKDSSVPPRWK